MLGIDLGTGSTKAAVVDEHGVVRGAGSADHHIEHPAPGAAEIDPNAWLASVAAATTAAHTAAGRPAVDAVGLAGQMHGVVFAGRDGTILRPAMLWPDTRAVAACGRYDRLDPAVRRALANPIVPGMFGPMLAAALSWEPELGRRLRWALSPKDWLRLRLTATAATEPSDASATLLWDIARDDWSDEALTALDLPPAVLPPVVASAARAGEVMAHGAEVLGVARGTPVAAGAGDTAAAIHGAGLRAGTCQVSVGSGAQIVAPLDEPHLVTSPVTHRYRRATPTGWYAMAAIQNAGLALQWVRAMLGVSWDALHASLDTVAPSADGVTFHPYLTGERTPLLDADVRGAGKGLALRHDRATLCRAALEGVSFSLRDGVRALEAEGIAPGPTRLVGGGIGDPRWQRLLAATLGRPLQVHRATQVTVLGAARLAATAVGRQLPMPVEPPVSTVEPDPRLTDDMDVAWQRWHLAHHQNTTNSRGSITER
ncbi:MAG: hypothetical protein KY460_06870 [Actinobacteria bacterium]|nr:hypothetical protein [Actinomycetota bacterium]